MVPPWWLLWPLRKAALLPAVGITFAAAGGALGSFDLAKKLSKAVLPSDPTLPAGTKKAGGGGKGGSAADPRPPLIVYLSSAAGAAAVVAVRELMFAPVVPPAPVLPVDGSVPMQARLRNAAVMALHTVVHYPYQFRFTTSFVAGTAGGVLFTLAERFFVAPASSSASAGAGRAESESARKMIAAVAAGVAANNARTGGRGDEEGEDYEEVEAGARGGSVRGPTPAAAAASSSSSSSSSSSHRSQPSAWRMVYDEDDSDAAWAPAGPSGGNARRAAAIAAVARAEAEEDAEEARHQSAGVGGGSSRFSFDTDSDSNGEHAAVQHRGHEMQQGDSYKDSYGGSGGDPFARPGDRQSSPSGADAGDPWASRSEGDGIRYTED
jgi:hypothetical protein